MKRFCKEFQMAETVMNSMNAIISKYSGRMNLRQEQPEIFEKLNGVLAKLRMTGGGNDEEPG